MYTNLLYSTSRRVSYILSEPSYGLDLKWSATSRDHLKRRLRVTRARRIPRAWTVTGRRASFVNRSHLLLPLLHFVLYLAIHHPIHTARYQILSCIAIMIGPTLTVSLTLPFASELLLGA